MSEELKPCPFCGHAATIEVNDNNYVISCGGLCDDVSTYSEMSYPMSEEQAIRVWNHRAERTCRRVREFVPYKNSLTGEYREVCSACGRALRARSVYRYCPNCGARVVDGDE